MPLNERESLSIQGGRGRENRLKGEVPTHFVFGGKTNFWGRPKGQRHDTMRTHDIQLFFFSFDHRFKYQAFFSI